MGILRTNKISGLGTDGTVFQGVTKFDTQGYFVAPSGTTDQRNAGITTTDGTIRFNTDSQKLEFYAQSQWWEMVIDTPALGVTANTDAGARGLVAGGNITPGAADANNIDYITISSTGNSIDFGDLNYRPREGSMCSSSTRGVFAGGYGPAPTLVNNISFVTISSTGDAADFGDLINGARRLMTSGSNSTRGLVPGGYTPGNANTNTIDAITIASTGNSFDFGDLANPIRDHATFASSTRCVLGGGSVPGTNTNRIEFIAIATLGNSQDFGDLSALRTQCGGGSNPTRGIFVGGGEPGQVNTIEYVTISTIGNSQNFGDLTQGVNQVYNVLTSPTRGVRCGGATSSPGFTNVMDYVLIQSLGDAVDFGDLVRGDSKNMAGCSNAHGGL